MKEGPIYENGTQGEGVTARQEIWLGSMSFGTHVPLPNTLYLRPKFFLGCFKQNTRKDACWTSVEKYAVGKYRDMKEACLSV